VMRSVRDVGATTVVTATMFTAPPPAPDVSVMVNGAEHAIKTSTWCIHPDAPDLDWVEVVLA
jgi:hypothetical protein